MKKMMLLLLPVLLLAGCTSNNAPQYVTDVDLLRAVAKPVEKLTEQDKQTIDDMKTMIEKDALNGLSAPAIGIQKRIMIVIDKDKPVVMINPSILESRDEQTRIETSPNLNGLSAVVKRSQTIKVKYFDESLKPRELNAFGGYAGVIQHHFEMLQGILFFDNARGYFFHQK